MFPQAVKSSTILERAMEKGTLGAVPNKASSGSKKHKKSKKPKTKPKYATCPVL